MKKIFAILILSAANAVFAQPTPEQVAAECMRQMALGICSARPDRSTITPGQTMLISGVGRVSFSAYMDYMDLFNEKVPTDPAMCDLALVKLSMEPMGDHAKIARALWTPAPEFEKKSIASEAAEIAIKSAAGVALALLAIAAIRRRAV